MTNDEELNSELMILKAKADERGLDVLVSLTSGTAKAVLPEHRKRVEADDDEEGIWYTEDHLAYARMPRVDL
jgi:hypothetical protein